MKIIFSPAKTLHLNVEHNLELKPLLYKDESIKLLNVLQKLTKPKIKNLFHLSDSLTQEVYDIYHHFNEQNQVYPAIQLYNGLAFRQLHMDVYTQKQMDYAEDHVRIISALYGVLSPLTGIWPYRLDFTINLGKINLKKYWTSKINDTFKDEDFIINIASEEFSSLITHPNLFTIHFFDEKNGQRKVNSAEAKKARGQTLEWCILHNVKDLNDLRNLQIKDYQCVAFEATQSIYIRKLD